MVYCEMNIWNPLAMGKRGRNIMRIAAIIAARMESSRLPGKVLMPIKGKPMLEHMIERIQHSSHVNEIVIATTHLPSDQPLADLAEKLGIGCFRGSVDDVLGRLHAAADSVNPDLVVELLGDNPLVHSDLIDDVIDFYRSGDFDYATSVTTEYPNAGPEVAKFPIGVRVQVYTPDVLSRCEDLARTSYNREHATTYIAEHPEVFKLGYLEAKDRWFELNRPDLTFAVNYRENFELVERLFEVCSAEDANFSLMTALKAFDARPELVAKMGTPSG